MKVSSILQYLSYIPLAVENRLFLKRYNRKLPDLVQTMRNKEKVKVLFVLSNLSKWKTEALYCAMKEHPRFEPVIGVALGVVDYPTYEANNLSELISYLNNKGYPFTELRLTADIQERIHPDIVFYQQADGGIYDCLSFKRMHDLLFCYVAYGVANGTDSYAYNNDYHNICLYWFVENQLVVDYASHVMNNEAVNLKPTGTPMMDELLEDKEKMVDPWKQQTAVKKRIIWAPHHTIGIGKEEIHYGTFLQIAEGMIELAKKYSNEIQWAFKPHPSLKQKLYYLWGEQRTNDYYNFWKDSETTQLENGKYIELFKFSDAMIHDCGTFTTEYLYMRKPCMYLVNGKNHPLNDFGQQCYDLYEKGKTIEDIEHFIQDVIHHIDLKREEREKFFHDYLVPPNGKTACENIIDTILGFNDTERKY